MHGSRDRPPCLSVALVSGAALGYEILLIRLFSIIQWHHFAWMIISLALLGYGASGTFITLVRGVLLRQFTTSYRLNLVLFGVAAVGCYRLVLQVPFNAEEILWAPLQAFRLMVLFVLLALPFFFAANAIALAFLRHTAAIGRIYAADLLGAGVGSLVLIVLLYLVFPETALKVLGATGLVAAAVATRELRVSVDRRTSAALLAAVAAMLLLPASWLEPQVSPYKGLSQALRVPGTEVIERRSSPLGEVAVLVSHSVPLRHAPGLSLQAGGAPLPGQLGLFTDADALTVINHNPEGAPLAYLDQLPSALPYHLAALHRVLVLGAGGGAAVQQALDHGVTEIDAVEINPDIIDLVRDTWGDWAGHLYDRDGVHVHIADSRGYLRQSRQRYDLIQIGLPESGTGGLPGLDENYLLTVEALEEGLAHLAPDGYLAISRWIRLPPRDLPKLLAMAVTALERTGSTDPGRQLVLVRGWQTGTLLIRNGVFRTGEITALRDFCTERAFDVAWYPGMPATAANRFNVLREAWFYQAARALTGDGFVDYIADYKFDIRPATDDRPYFSRFFRWAALPEILDLRGRGGLPLLEAGYLLLIATLGIAGTASLLLILLPLWRVRARPRERLPGRGVARTGLYFLAIGLAFLFLEIACIQKFILFLQHPLYAVATVLTAFLVFAGLGSAWAGRTSPASARAATTIRLAVAGIAGSGLLYVLLLDTLFTDLVALPLFARVPVTLLLLAPMAFCMGVPFPLGLARLAGRAPELVPWAWGINGCASVLSAILATLLAIESGFTTVILAAIGLYLVAAWNVP